MNILIVGCGRVGRRLVHVLERLGHDVSVLDEDAANLALLNELSRHFPAWPWRACPSTAMYCAVRH